jgi:hypothetical protein
LPTEPCAQSRNRSCNRAGLSRAALPVGVPGHSVIVPDGVEPSFPVCRTGVVAVGPRDRAFKWTHWESHPDFKLAELVSSCWTMSPSRWKLDHRCAAVPDSNPQVACATECFKQCCCYRGPAFFLLTSRRACLASVCMTSVLSCGSWNRTNIKTFRASRPTVRRSRNVFFFLLPPCAHMPSGHVCSVASSGGRNRTYGLLRPTLRVGARVRHHYQQRRPRNTRFVSRVPCESRSLRE